MVGMFNPSNSYDPSFVEAVVTNVDPVRFICTVKTTKGQYLNDVGWLLPAGSGSESSMHLAPTVNSRVVVCTSLSYPMIIGSMPRLGIPSGASASGTTLGVDPGSNSNITGGMVLHPDKPADFVPGDHVITTKGGGMLAVLVGGTIIAKASGLAQIMMSRFGDLVRVVARNFYRFSDASSEVSTNIRGRLYHWFGADTSLVRSKAGTEIYNEVYGDVSIAEYFRGNPSNSVTPPGVDTRIVKKWLTNGATVNYMTHTMYSSGKMFTEVNNVGYTTTLHDNAEWTTVCSSPAMGVWSEVKLLPISAFVNWNDFSSVYMDANKLEAKFGDVGLMHMDPNKLEIKFGTNCLIHMDSGKLQASFGANNLKIDGTSAILTVGAHSVGVDAAGTHLM